MQDLLAKLNNFMSDICIGWCLCGGLSTDMYINKVTRPHKDIDISIFSEDIGILIDYIHGRNWDIKAPTKSGFVDISPINYKNYAYNNLWCFNNEFNRDYIERVTRNGIENYKFIDRNQIALDYIEVLLNKRNDSHIIYRRNNKIRRKLEEYGDDHSWLEFL